MTMPEDPARTSHRLQLPRSTPAQDVLTMVLNVRPQAVQDEDGTIVIGEDARLVPDRGKRGAGRWDLDVPKVREDPPAEGSQDSHGYHRAFPEGLPFGAEREALDLAWSLGRRLTGAIVTDSGARIEPHPFHVRDLIVVSPHALAPESLATLIAPLEPEAELDEVPDDVPRAGYSATVPLQGGDEIALRVGRTEAPTALRELPWLSGAVDYRLVHIPADEEEGDVETPDAGTAAQWQEAYRRIGLLAGLLLETVGGYVVDLEGFLVDPKDLV